MHRNTYNDTTGGFRMIKGFPCYDNTTWCNEKLLVMCTLSSKLSAKLLRCGGHIDRRWNWMAILCEIKFHFTVIINWSSSPSSRSVLNKTELFGHTICARLRCRSWKRDCPWLLCIVSVSWCSTRWQTLLPEITELAQLVIAQILFWEACGGQKRSVRI